MSDEEKGDLWNALACMVAGMVAAAAVSPLLVSTAWRVLVVPLGLPAIGYWQAFGLLWVRALYATKRTTYLESLQADSLSTSGKVAGLWFATRNLWGWAVLAGLSWAGLEWWG